MKMLAFVLVSLSLMSGCAHVSPGDRMRQACSGVNVGLTEATVVGTATYVSAHEWIRAKATAQNKADMVQRAAKLDASFDVFRAFIHGVVDAKVDICAVADQLDSGTAPSALLAQVPALLGKAAKLIGDIVAASQAFMSAVKELKQVSDASRVPRHYSPVYKYNCDTCGGGVIYSFDYDNYERV